MPTQRYNGWTNYETWNVALWIDNEQAEQASSEYWAGQAQEAWDTAEPTEVWTREDAATYALADQLKEDFEAGKDELLEDAKKTSSVWADLLGAALSEVDWQEIARHYLDDVEKTVEA